MWWKIVLILILIAIIIYLNRAYAAFYFTIGKENLPNPNISEKYAFGNESEKTQFKYVALGDSLTAGVGSKDFHNTYPFKLAEKLSQDKKSVELINLGQPSAKSRDLLLNQLDKAILEKPDLITILIGINDTQNFVPQKTYQKNLNEILSKLKENTTARIILINIPHLVSGALKNTPFEFYLDKKAREFNQVILQISKAEGLEYIDLYTPSKLESSSNPEFYSEDFFHPSDKGYLEWSNIINANISI